MPLWIIQKVLKGNNSLIFLPQNPYGGRQTLLKTDKATNNTDVGSYVMIPHFSFQTPTQAFDNTTNNSDLKSHLMIPHFSFQTPTQA